MLSLHCLCLFCACEEGLLACALGSREVREQASPLNWESFHDFILSPTVISRLHARMRGEVCFQLDLLKEEKKKRVFKWCVKIIQ